MQERERRKESWAPRWFRPAKETEVYPAEYSLEECPMWEFTGEYLKQPRTPAKPEGERPSQFSSQYPCQLQDVMLRMQHGVHILI